MLFPCVDAALCCETFAHLLDVAYPVLYVVEGFLIGDVIHQHDALEHKRQEVMPEEVTGRVTLAGSARPSGIQLLTPAEKCMQLFVWSRG